MDGMAGGGRDILGSDRPKGSPLDLDCTDLKQTDPEENEKFRLYDSRGCFVGIFRYHPAGKQLRPEKMFYDPDQPDRGRAGR